MSDLTYTEKRCLEQVLGMLGGYVLDFTNPTFDEFFRQYGIPIYDDKYGIYGPSKAKRMRAFWEKESNQTVAKVLTDMLNLPQAVPNMDQTKCPSAEELDRGRRIVERLSGEKPKSKDSSEQDFLKKEFKSAIHNVKELPITPQVSAIIQKRIDEAHLALSARAWLSVILMCGSALEGILLGIAEEQCKLFRENAGSEKELQKWTLAELIDTAYKAKLLELDVRKFSHVLRDFRNYIHPYCQMTAKFTPTEHTAKICFQVLNAAVANLVAAKSPKTY